VDTDAKKKFEDGLTELGYSVLLDEENRPHILHTIKIGRFKGYKVKIGFEIPADFELTPPSGPHISPKLIPIRPDGPDHTTRAHPSSFGDEWEYLSRPISNWAEKRTVKRYMKYVIHLLDTL